MKKLIIIGNKPINMNISDFINEFDMIFRVNKMDNVGYTGTRTDGCWLEYNKDFNKHLGRKEVVIQNIKKYLPIIYLPYNSANGSWYKKFIKNYPELKNQAVPVDYENLLVPYNSISIIRLISVIFQSEEYNEYEKYLICHDLDRYNFDKSILSSDCYHYGSKEKAEEYINNLIKTNQLKYIDTDNYIHKREIIKMSE